ncbi:hypothetical protein VF04_04125 [Nostoc linckia z7]|nr:helix-turn-helix domain-containing protein [Nostoc linckia]PHK42900.1 hypothetical protein VF12_00825 [Nostoc linckia z15]PHK48057.1 hypothetical protein VF13_01800 [Nostoc linckia z16]PHJ64977.1 hypothetical protein VF02_11610 [Nostoc linckia z1]PHJ70155.1 hypothetical protein VF05_11770 [Nostoc linckia z3]PHK00100.1 hypothetical protein VF04_04125 [Nostoc linckia z7]
MAVLKMGAPRTIDPERVKELIKEAEAQKRDWSYPELAKILSEETGKEIKPDAVSKCARINGIILPKLSGRKPSKT